MPPPSSQIRASAAKKLALSWLPRTETVFELVCELDLIKAAKNTLCVTPVAYAVDELVSQNILVGLPSTPVVVVSPMVTLQYY